MHVSRMPYNERCWVQSIPPTNSLIRVHQGVSIDLGIDQLKLTGTYLAGDYEGTRADKVIANAVVAGEALQVEKSLSEIFPN